MGGGEKTESGILIGVVKKPAMSLSLLLICRILESCYAREKRSLKLDERLHVVLG